MYMYIYIHIYRPEKRSRNKGCLVAPTNIFTEFASSLVAIRVDPLRLFKG